MSGITTNSSGPPQQTTHSGSGSETQVKFPRLYMVILFALVSIVFTAVWLGIYQFFNKAIWSNDFVTSHKWTIIVGVLFFSLLVGLTQKYLRAPTVIHGGAAESIKGGKEPDYTTFPGVLPIKQQQLPRQNKHMPSGRSALSSPEHLAATRIAFAIGYCFRVAALWFKWEEPMPRLPSHLFQGETERESLKEKMQPGWEPEE